MSNPIGTLWRLMRDKFGPESVDEDAFGEALLYSQEEIPYQYRRLTEPCPHLLTFWLDRNNNAYVKPGEVISVRCSKCGGSFVGRFKGYYELSANDKGEPWILCKVCGMKSFHPKDIENKHCGNCRRFYG